MKQLSILIPVHFCQRNCINFIFFLASAATLINIKNARKHFEKLERVDSGHSSIASRQESIGLYKEQLIIPHSVPSFQLQFFVLTVADSAAKYQNALSQLLKIIMSALCQLLSTLLTHAHWFIDAIKVLGFFQ